MLKRFHISSYLQRSEQHQGAVGSDLRRDHLLSRRHVPTGLRWRGVYLQPGRCSLYPEGQSHLIRSRRAVRDFLRRISAQLEAIGGPDPRPGH